MQRFLQLSHWLCLMALLSVSPLDAFEPDAAKKSGIDFAKEIRPLFQANCFSCHGKEKQEGGLRLDQGKLALKGGESGKIIVPGKPEESRLIRIIQGKDDDLGIMPPEGEGRPLSKAEITQIAAWIKSGAKWPAAADEDAAKTHWAFQPLTRPSLPAVKNRQWIRSPIDYFVLAKLESHRLQPSTQANRSTLIRRVYLDLLGLPPTVEDVRTYLNDSKPGAYERMLERALSSPHYGERWGRHWLDLARYADSDGYEKDRPRPHAWRYRSWVISALNRDTPFDRFSISQIAGDLLPDASTSDRVAAGFHRNTLHNTEGGTDKEEDRFKKTVDRTNTVSTIWLGLTVGCAQCHTHKYDPITHREYYQMFAFFNDINEQDIKAPTNTEQSLYEARKALFDAMNKPRVEALAKYEREQLPKFVISWEKSLGSAKPTWSSAKSVTMKSAKGATFEVSGQKQILVKGKNEVSDIYTATLVSDLKKLAAIRLEALPHKSLAAQGPGRARNGNFVLAEIRASLQRGKNKITIKLNRAKSDFSQKDWPVAAALSKKSKNGWAVSPKLGTRHIAVFTLEKPIEIKSNDKIVIELDQTYKGDPHNLGHFRLSLSADPTADLEDGIPEAIRKIVATARDKRNAKMTKQLTEFAKAKDPAWVKLKSAVDAGAKKAPAAPGTSAQSIVEVSKPRETKIHIRGEFLRKGELVKAGVPTFLPNLDKQGRTNRLDFAKWIFAKENPLSARVTANRVWHRLFGRGIVSTVDDFGTQSAEPTHPELLDWLANYLVDSNWSLKRLQREILLSATYRQAAALRPELKRVDPENELLARHPRRRVESEIVRDLALSVSGLLQTRVGGPSVRPQQPAEYSNLTYANSAKWKTSTGGDQYRRGLYTFFQRTSPYPMLMTFDSPDSNTCAARRSLSNTPLQALTIWNDPVFFQAAQRLGQRVVAENADAGPDSLAQRIDYLFLAALARHPSESEIKTVKQLYREQFDLIEKDSEAAKAVAGSHRLIGSNAEVATWVMLSRTVLNLDEFITKE